MSDELEVRELISHLYAAADQIRPDPLRRIDGSDPIDVAGALEYLIQHARATEGGLRKIGQLMDEQRADVAGLAKLAEAAAEVAAEAASAASRSTSPAASGGGGSTAAAAGDDAGGDAIDGDGDGGSDRDGKKSGGKAADGDDAGTPDGD